MFKKTENQRLEGNQSPTASPQALINKRIVITRSEAQAESMRQKLADWGVKPIVFPVIRFVALPPESLDEALAQFKQFDWIVFTSVNAVEFFFRRVDEMGYTLKMPRVATVGSATAVALQTRSITIDYTPDEFVGEALAAGLGDLSGQRVLLPRALKGRPQIVTLLRQQGASVADIALYDTVTAVPTSDALAQLEQGFDVVTFTSPSSVRNFLRIIDEYQPQLRAALKTAIIACIGPVTAEEANNNGLLVAVIPDEYTIDSLIQAINDYFENLILDT